MASEQNGRGLATAPSSLKKRNPWKNYFVLSVNALSDDDVVLWDIKARNSEEAYEIADAGSHNLDSYILFNEKSFKRLCEEVAGKSRHQTTPIDKLGNSSLIIFEALADYRCWWSENDNIDLEKREQIDRAVEMLKEVLSQNG